jgi:hypothetical protein
MTNIKRDLFDSNMALQFAIQSIESYNYQLGFIKNIKDNYSLEDLDLDFIYGTESFKKTISSIGKFLVESLQKLFLAICNFCRNIVNFIQSQFMKLKIKFYEENINKIHSALNSLKSKKESLEKMNVLVPVNNIYKIQIKNHNLLNGVASFLKTSNLFLIPFQNILNNIQNLKKTTYIDSFKLKDIISIVTLKDSIFQTLSFNNQKVKKLFSNKNTNLSNILSWPNNISNLIFYDDIKPKRSEINPIDFLVNKVSPEILSNDTLKFMNNFVYITKNATKIFSSTLIYAKKAYILIEKINESKMNGGMINKTIYKLIAAGIKQLNECGLINRAFNNFIISLSLNIYQEVLRQMNYCYRACNILLKEYNIKKI